MQKSKESLFKLTEWFNINARILPWRNNPSPYHVWVSEIMLQQTTVAVVTPYFERFIFRFPSVDSLAKAHLDEVLRFWAGLGYYSRAKNLHRAAGIVARNGVFPQSREEWLKLPGVGEYTAGAVLSIAFNKPEPVLDANIKRVISRLRMLKTGTNKKIFWNWSRLIVDCAYKHKIPPGIINQALMELGALVCVGRNPFCLKCTLSGICKAYKADEVNNYPGKIKKRWVKVHEKVYCFISGGNKVLLEQKINSRWRKGLWDFPVEIPDIFIKQALRQKPAVFKSFYTVTNHKIEREHHIYHINDQNEALKNPLKWIPLSSVDNPAVAVGSPVRKSLALINDFIKKERRLPDGD